MKVLLIEPDVVQAKAYQTALKTAGHTVQHARSAQSAVHLADGNAPDVVVLELQLPRHNGVEFLYEFRSYPEWQHIPVVIHTFVPLAELQPQPTLRRELGVARMLYKPETSLKQLCQAVQAAVSTVV